MGRNNLIGVNNLTKSDFDITNYPYLINEDNLINLDGYYLSEIGLLSLREYNLINEGVNTSYLSSDREYFLINAADELVWVVRDGNLDKIPYTSESGVRPVVNVAGKIVSGSGIMMDPYVIEE